MSFRGQRAEVRLQKWKSESRSPSRSTAADSSVRPTVRGQRSDCRTGQWFT